MARIFKVLLACLTGLASINTSSAAVHVDRVLQEPGLLRQLDLTSRARLFVMSDIQNDPDDEMSMVRLLMYADHFDIQGICATTSASMRNNTHPESIRKAIHAYGKVVHNLNKHINPKSKFPDAFALETKISSGPLAYGMEALKLPLSGGAQSLIDSLESSEEPLYVSIWGGANTLAQALEHLHKTRSPIEAAELRSKLKVYSISDQDDTGPWVRQQWPEITYIVNSHGFQEYEASTWAGINSPDNGAANITKVQQPWLDENIRIGSLGEVYPEIKYGMEGDTPSFLWLLQNGLSNPARIDWGGWGGRYTRIQEAAGFNMYSYSTDTVRSASGTPYRSAQATVWRWRDAYQDDFAARMQWTMTDKFEEAAHPPVVQVNTSKGFEPLVIELAFNDSIILDASHTIDTDHPDDNSHLDFEWFWYAEVGFPRGFGSGVLPDFIKIEPVSSPTPFVFLNDTGAAQTTPGQLVRITYQVPSDSSILTHQDWHVILQVRNNKGHHPIRRYKRVIFRTAQ